MTIRRTLIGLTSFLGLALLAAVTVQIWASAATYRRADALVESDAARTTLTEAASVLAAERSRMYLELKDALPPGWEIAGVRQDTDQALAAATEVLLELDPDLGDELRVFFDMPRRILELRASASASASAALGAMEIVRRQVAEQWFQGMVSAIESVEALQLELVSEIPASDPLWTAATEVETLSSALLEHVYRNQARIPALLAAGNRDPNLLDPAQRNAANTELTLRHMLERPIPEDPLVERHVSELANAYFSSYRPSEIATLQALAQDRRATRDPEDWLVETARVLPWIERLQEDLHRLSEASLIANRTQAAWAASMWLTLLMLGAAAVAGCIHVIQRRVLFPIETLREAMLQLARGRFDTPLPDSTRKDEVGAMADALRVFKANAIRRKRLQDERTVLHGRLENAYRQVTEDLEAAAAVQASLLPEPGRVNGISYFGYFRPAHFIAGDTYNVIPLADGRVIFFLVDVAGHGAPAALISMASHHNLVRTLIARQPHEGLAEAVKRLNAEWPDNMSIFTMVLGELDPASGKCCLVQAGHPPPILFHRDGRARFLGAGGLPIGVIPGATFEEVSFDFLPGDRILVYSDGLTEAENEAEEPFSEDRLHDLVQRHSSHATPILLEEIERSVRSWRQARKLDDDLTVLIMEAEREE